jgi:hypothetical protein
VGGGVLDSRSNSESDDEADIESEASKVEVGHNFLVYSTRRKTLEKLRQLRQCLTYSVAKK